MKFRDISRVNDTLESKSQIENIDIGKSDGLTAEQARSFWDNEFDCKEKEQDSKSINEDISFNDIYDRDEREFDFEFDIDEDIKVVLEKFDPGSWEQLSDIEKETNIQELISMIGEKLGLDEIPVLRFFEDSINKCGAFIQPENSIEINRNIFSDPKEVIDTTAHEVRHAYQHQRALRNETYVDKLYKYNFDNYITPIELSDGKYLLFTDYQDQYVEAEARAFANIFNKKEASQ